jgi:hypothetical protein
LKVARPPISQVGTLNERIVSGYQVNKEGEKVTITKNGEPSYVLVMAHPDEIVAELRMNLHYGMLEKVDGTDV